jgi:hypothetical protein
MWPTQRPGADYDDDSDDEPGPPPAFDDDDDSDDEPPPPPPDGFEGVFNTTPAGRGPSSSGISSGPAWNAQQAEMVRRQLAGEDPAPAGHKEFDEDDDDEDGGAHPYSREAANSATRMEQSDADSNEGSQKMGRSQKEGKAMRPADREKAQQMAMMQAGYVADDKGGSTREDMMAARSEVAKDEKGAVPKAEPAASKKREKTGLGRWGTGGDGVYHTEEEEPKKKGGFFGSLFGGGKSNKNLGLTKEADAEAPAPEPATPIDELIAKAEEEARTRRPEPPRAGCTQHTAHSTQHPAPSTQHTAHSTQHTADRARRAPRTAKRACARRPPPLPSSRSSRRHPLSPLPPYSHIRVLTHGGGVVRQAEASNVPPIKREKAVHGWVFKRGGVKSKAWKKRYCVYEPETRRFTYYDSDSAAFKDEQRKGRVLVTQSGVVNKAPARSKMQKRLQHGTVDEALEIAVEQGDGGRKGPQYEFKFNTAENRVFEAYVDKATDLRKWLEAMPHWEGRLTMGFLHKRKHGTKKSR